MVVGITEIGLIPQEYAFLNIPSLAIVLGGILCSTFVSYPFKNVLKALRESLRLFSQSKITEDHLEQDLESILEWNKMIKADKMKAISDLSERYTHQFEGFLFSLLDTNYSTDELRKLGEANIHENYSRQLQINQIIQSMGKAAPVFGMLGTLFGLIVILSGFDDTEYLLSGLAAALMTTFYGIVIGSFIFIPVGKKMDNNASLLYFRESLILEGILLIEQNKSSLQIYDILQAHLRRNRYPDLSFRE